MGQNKKTTNKKTRSSDTRQVVDRAMQLARRSGRWETVRMKKQIPTWAQSADSSASPRFAVD